MRYVSAAVVFAAALFVNVAAQAEKRTFIIANNADGYGVDRCLATGASWVCYFRALKLGEAYRVAPIDKLSVVLVAIFAVAFLGERPAPRDWAGIACVAVGVLLLSLKR